MANYLGDFALGATFDTKFCTVQSTGAPTTLSASPVISAYVDNSTTQLTAGITLTVDFDSVTGLNNVRVVATGANGYLAGSNYQLIVTVGTVNSVSAVGYVVGEFSLQARPVQASATGATPALGIVEAGTATAGAATTITLRAGSSATNSIYNGHTLFITGGTGVGQSRLITGYVGGTLVATVDTWQTNPDSTSVYIMIATPPASTAVPAPANVTQALGTAVTTTTAGILDVNTKNINNVAAATPGASGGILISGSNAGTTTLAALTVTGTMTVSDGIAVARSTGNGTGLTITGNGTGAGATITSGNGATGNGLNVTSAATNGSGVVATATGTGNGIKAASVSGDALSAVASTSGNGITATGAGTTKHGIAATGGATTSDGIRAVGGGVGNGITATSGGGATGNGISATSVATNGQGVNTAGVGTGAGVLSTGGATGVGIKAVGGATSGAGITASATSGDGATLTGGTNGNGVTMTHAGTGKDLNATTTPLIAASVAGAVASVTGAVGSLGATAKTDVSTAVLTTAMTESYAPKGAAMTLAQAAHSTLQGLTEFSTSGTTVTVKKRDQSTTAYTETLDSSTAPTSITQAT